jgi:hypothetical protein
MDSRVDFEEKKVAEIPWEKEANQKDRIGSCQAAGFPQLP